MHSSYFVLKNKEGKQAEQLVKDYLTDRGYTVQDVSEEQDNYQNDIDFIVRKDGRTSKIEVKLDTRLAETQNICSRLPITAVALWFLECKKMKTRPFLVKG